MHPSVAVCICTRDRPETLRSVAASHRPVGTVVVSDDGQDPATVDVCLDAGIDVSYVRGPQRGLGPNRNHALRQTDEDFVLFLDDDCLMGSDFLDLMLAKLAVVEGGGGTEVIVTGAEKTPRQARKLPAAQTFLGFQARPYGAGERLTSINISCTLFPRSLFLVHEFDPLIRYGYDEVDIASRAVAGGYTIVLCPEAVNDHRPSPDSRADYLRYKTAARLYVTFKRYCLTERRYRRAATYLLVAPLHAVVGGARSHGWRGLRQALSAVALAAGYFRAHVASAPR